jgi:hypothetical protein
MSRASFFWLFCGVAACSGPSATIDVTTGGEPDALTKDPAVTTIELDAVGQSGTTSLLAPTSVVSNATLDLGDQSQDIVGSVQFTGTDDAGDVVVFGATPFAELGALSGDIPLFVQRRGEFARMPPTDSGSPLPDGRAAPLLAITNADVYVAGGSVAGSTSLPPLAAYDLLNLDLGDTIAAPQDAKSFALVQLTDNTGAPVQNNAGDLAAMLFVDGTSGFILGLPTDDSYLDAGFELSYDGGTGNDDATVPWSDFSGGATVMGDDGTAYIVGGSRVGPASTSAIAFWPTLASDGTFIIKVSSELHPRQGAAVAWSAKYGVVLYGGNVDTTTAGVSFLDPQLGETAFNYPPITTQGLAAIAFDDQTILVAGDLQPMTVDLNCDASCAPVAWGAQLPSALTSPSLFSIGSKKFLLVGDDASGATRAFVLDGSSTTPPEVPLNIPRQHARAIQTNTGAVLVIGGGSPTIESYVP